MLFGTSALLALAGLRVTAYPHPESGWTHHVESTNMTTHTPRGWTHHVEIHPKRSVTHHVELPSNATLEPRAEKGICTTLDLPTEASYRIGYDAFCNRYVPDDRYLRMGSTDDALVATYMIKNHLGADIPWIFKISSNSWGGAKPYLLKRDMCITGFRAMLEGERAKLGKDYCVVDGSGGNGASKKFWGQGYVLVLGSERNWGPGNVNDGSKFETRRRKGEFDPNNPGGQ